MSEPVTYLGAKLRELAAEHGSGVTQLGTLFVRVTCHGNEWACELNDDKPVFPWQAQEWGKAVGVPEGTEWRHTAQLMVARCEWTGTEEPAAAGTQAFYLGGGRMTRYTFRGLCRMRCRWCGQEYDGPVCPICSYR